MAFLSASASELRRAITELERGGSAKGTGVPVSPLERRSAQAPPGEHDLNVAMLRQLRSSLALAEAVAPRQRQPASSPRRGYSHSPCSTVVKRGPCGVKPSRRGVRGRRGGHSHRDNAARRVVLKARASSLREVRERRGLVAGQRLSRDGAMFTGQRSEGEGGMVSPCGSATGDQVGDGAFCSAGAPSRQMVLSARPAHRRCVVLGRLWCPSHPALIRRIRTLLAALLSPTMAAWPINSSSRAW